MSYADGGSWTWGGLDSDATAPPQGSYGRSILKKYDTGLYYSQPNIDLSGSDSPAHEPLDYVDLGNGVGGTTLVDWFFLTKYYEPEPLTVVSVEEAAGFAAESSGREAIEEGIREILTSEVIYTNQSLFISYANGSQMFGMFDKVVRTSEQVWAFNYLTSGESATQMWNVSNRIYVWEESDKTYAEIQDAVSDLINTTKI